MSEENLPAVQFELHVESLDDEPTGSDWQGECRHLYNRIADALDEGDVQPRQQPTQPGDRGDVFEVFHQLVAYGISIKAFAALFQVTKLWLEHRPRCDVTLKLADGSEIKVSKVSVQEAERLMQEHQQRSAQL